MLLFSPSRILRSAVQKQHTPKWSDTLNLPRSTFPARPNAQKLEQYRQRCADDLYEWQLSNRPVADFDHETSSSKEFVLHDGPPYANGPVHVGHALNKVLKDLILRWQLSIGKRVHYRPGWDCHGLPIELKALQAYTTRVEQASTLKDAPTEETAAVGTGRGMNAGNIRRMASELASATIEKQKANFREWGILGEWDAPYKTMDSVFEIDQLKVFKEMVRKGFISRHYRPVYWSPSSRTALAEAELEYNDAHKCIAAFVKLSFVRIPSVLKRNPQVKYLLDSGTPLSALIWTTTPWTLPANQAVAIGRDIVYTVVTFSSSDFPDTSQDLLLVARDRLDHVLSFLPKGTIVTIVADGILGTELADDGAVWNPFRVSESVLTSAKFVTSGSGTGLVHMAPGHGMDDYQTWKGLNLGKKSATLIAPVDDDGRYTADVFPLDRTTPLIGLDVQTDGAQEVLKMLNYPSEHFNSPRGEASEKDSKSQKPGSLVLATHEFVHKNPIDWRTKQPVIVRATPQWFADVSMIKDHALTALDNVDFVPAGGSTRLRSFIEGRSQWCISRQRPWGVPIPALYHKTSGEACITEESIDHIMETLRQRGTDAWFLDPPDDAVWIHSSLDPHAWVRGTDTMDVWFDSGTTWTTLKESSEQGKPLSDVYLEGTDQHRGWFQSSLLTYVATNSNPGGQPAGAPFKQLITHGFTLDAEGRKMSKSLGNVISPDQILDGSLLPLMKSRKQKGKGGKMAQTDNDKPHYDAMGPDALRLWVASSDYTRDVHISVPVLQGVHQALQKYRVTLKFLLGVLSDYNRNGISVQNRSLKLTFADEAILARLLMTQQGVEKANNEHRFNKAVNEINDFINIELSGFYFEIIKDVMYAGSREARRRTQAVLKVILDGLLGMLGPITPHLVEEVWEHRPQSMHGDIHPLRKTWKELASGVTDFTTSRSQDRMDNRLEAFKLLSNAVKLAQEEARTAGKVGSGLACKVVIQFSDDGDDAAQEQIMHWHQAGELEDLLVVSEVEVSRDRDSPVFGDAAWSFEKPLQTEALVDVGKVTVLPPSHHKCVRCWKYTAEEEEKPCIRCQDVLEEQGLMET